MKLNRAEALLVNNPVRALVQHFYEAPVLRNIGGTLDGKRVLEIGCGNGTGAKVLLDRLGAKEVIAVDLDVRQVRRAQRLLFANTAGRVSLMTANVRQLPFRNESFDAVADFGVLHHVVEWQAGLSEVRRVLKPFGRFLFEEVTREALKRWFYRTFLDHPTENRFSKEEFVAELQALGIELTSSPRSLLGGDIFVGVGRRLA
ncbi:MAG: class I SAM-dependent methyltransferase [Acidobacteriaceae bacterium]|nr:class I SAM-dependent methyltransferase [Acidobacteriaceae bacterium]